MNKKSTTLKIIMWILIGLLAVGATGGIIYYTYYNAKVTHTKKYKLEEYKSDQSNIKIEASTNLNTQSAKQIYSDYLTISKGYKEFDKDKFIRNYIQPVLSFRQAQNLKLKFTSLNYEDSKPNQVTVSFEIQDKQKKYPVFKSENIQINIWTYSFNNQNNQAFKDSFESSKSDLLSIINDPKSKNPGYYDSEEFRTKVFSWFKKIANNNRPNMYPVKDYDIAADTNVSPYITYRTKNGRNLLSINFIFIHKGDSKTVNGQRIELYIN